VNAPTATAAETRNRYAEFVQHELRLWRWWTRIWSLLHHGSLFLAAVLSAAAALVLQLNSLNWTADTKADVAAILAASAAVMGVISTAGGFGKKWRTNRLTKSKLQQLSVYLMSPSCDLEKVEQELIGMVKVHHEGIVSSESSGGD
jgi:hypothetical protein